VLPGILPIVARSRSEAQEKEDLLEKLVPERVGIDLSTYDGRRTNLERLRLFAKERLTIWEMARRIANAGTVR
jgi:hypothetical protein